MDIFICCIVFLAALVLQALPLTISKEFHLGDILSISHDFLLPPNYMDGVYNILNFMSETSLYTHQLPRAADKYRPHLLKQLPFLNSPDINYELGRLKEMLDSETGKKELELLATGWLLRLTNKYGEFHTVRILHQISPERTNPISELFRMINKPECYKE